VRPGDDDGTPTEADDELVAQIIPLRRRDQASATQTLPDEQSERLPRTHHSLPPAERSVWDQPTTELRRRTPARACPDAREHRDSWRSERPRSVKVAAAVFASVLCAGLLALTLDTLKGRSAPAPARAQGSAGSAISASNQAGTASSRSSRSPVSASRGRATHQPKRHQRPRARHRAGPPKRAASTTPTVELAASSAGGATRGVESAAASAVENAPAPAQSPVPSHDTPPPPAQNQCVPGELGC
jgi:hypothetical protein